MALPMDEQRILDEMERMLAADDPKLAARLAAFGQPGFGHVLRTRRARATMSVMALVLIAAVAVVIYTVISLRLQGGTSRHPGQHPTVSTSKGRSGPRSPSSNGTASASAAALGSQSGQSVVGKPCIATFCPEWPASITSGISPHSTR